MKFDYPGHLNPKNKLLNIFVLDENELSDFEGVATQDFSNLETFYNAIRKAKDNTNSKNAGANGIIT